MGRKRIAWLDYARSIAIVCVCICHSTEIFYHGVLIGESDVTNALWFLLNSLYTFGRIGVPLFLMLTGALMLGKDIAPNVFYKKYFFPLLITTEIWIIINTIFTCLINSCSINLKTLAKQILFFENPYLQHMWYMPMILGIYVVLPVLSTIVKNNRLSDLIFPILFTFCVFFFIPTINAVANKNYNTVLDISFFGGIYGLYVILGYYIYNINIKIKINLKRLTFIFVVAFLISSFIQYFLHINKMFTISFLWYSSPFILIMSTVLFVFLKNIDINSEKINSISKKLSQKSFGIYLTHNIILTLIQKYIFGSLYFNNVSIIFKIILLFISSLLFSYLITSMVFKISKKLSKLLFNM